MFGKLLVVIIGMALPPLLLPPPPSLPRMQYSKNLIHCAQSVSTFMRFKTMKALELQGAMYMDYFVMH